MKIHQHFTSILILFTFLNAAGMAQTTIPNAGFEQWINYSNYSNPSGWDTPNEELMAIPFFGFQVVTKSTDHYGPGSFSAKLETKHLVLPPLDIPGFMTCGKLVVDIASGSYTLSGGVPVVDQPTHLKGFFKYLPKGGDSCVIGIGLTKTAAGIQDTVGVGYFSTRDTVNDWTPFSAWIDYYEAIQPDTMNIIAMSTAQEVMTPGTVLYVDGLYLDYTLATPGLDPAAGISIYHDRETRRILCFFDFPEPRTTTIRLLEMTGRTITRKDAGRVERSREAIGYEGLPQGIVILEIVHDGCRFTKKILLIP
jgi:hypothetical protein